MISKVQMTNSIRGLECAIEATHHHASSYFLNEHLTLDVCTALIYGPRSSIRHHIVKLDVVINEGLTGLCVYRLHGDAVAPPSRFSRVPCRTPKRTSAISLSDDSSERRVALHSSNPTLTRIRMNSAFLAVVSENHVPHAIVCFWPGCPRAGKVSHV